MIKSARRWIRNFFGFSRMETDGFLVLLFIIVLLLFAPYIFEWTIASTYTASTKDKIILDRLVQQLNQEAEHLKKGREKKRGKEKLHELNLFSFNPNEEDLQTFLLLGLPEDIGKRIINYRKAGGNFRIKSDLSKIYGLSPETYEQLYQYIQLPEKEPVPRYHNKKHKNTFSKAGLSKEKTNKQVKVLFDINTCDTITLKKLYGIGSVLAERVIKYRALLGGFVSKEQLQEVYGLKEEALFNLYQSSYIAPTFVPKKIKVNEENIREMAVHPYISYSLAKAIYAYRNQHGKYTVPESLLNIHILDSALFVKLRPYIAL